ncbi:hypothetical protein BDR22DRAFT_556365 [Usnea florida]
MRPCGCPGTYDPLNVLILEDAYMVCKSYLYSWAPWPLPCRESWLLPRSTCRDSRHSRPCGLDNLPLRGLMALHRPVRRSSVSLCPLQDQVLPDLLCWPLLPSVAQVLFVVLEVSLPLKHVIGRGLKGLQCGRRVIIRAALVISDPGIRAGVDLVEAIFCTLTAACGNLVGGAECCEACLIRLDVCDNRGLESREGVVVPCGNSIHDGHEGLDQIPSISHCLRLTHHCGV